MEYRNQEYYECTLKRRGRSFVASAGAETKRTVPIVSAATKRTVPIVSGVEKRRRRAEE